MKKTKLLVVQQYFGLGDCIFGAHIATLINRNTKYKVIWPVEPHFVEGLNRAYPEILYADRTLLKADYENKLFREIYGMMHLPLRYSESLLGRPYKDHMRSKYDYVNQHVIQIRWEEWVNTTPVIDNKKAHGLFKHFDLDPTSKYNLIATDFGNKGRSVEISVDNGYRNILLKPVPGYSLFDWVPIMQCAATIHAVSSSSLYLFELFPPNTKEIHLYCRKPVEQNFEYVDFLFTRPYILHT